MTVASIATLGLPELANREIPAFQHTTATTTSAFVRLGNRVTLWLGSILGLGLGVSLWLLDVPSQSPAPLLLILLVPLMTFLTWRRQLALIGERHALGLLAPALVSLAALPVAGGLLYFTPTAASPLLGLAASNAIVILLLMRSAKLSSDGSPKASTIQQRRRVWLKSGAVILMSNLATMVAFQLDVLLISYFATASETGAYSAASRLSLLTTMALAGIAVREGPRFGRLLAVGDQAGCWSHFKRSCVVSGTLGLALAVLLAAGSEILLGAYGEGFSVAAPWLVILLVGRLVSAATGPAAILLVAAGRQRDAALAAWMGLGAAVITIVGFGLTLGPAGVAIGASCGTAFRTIVQMLYARRALVSRAPLER